MTIDSQLQMKSTIYQQDASSSYCIILPADSQAQTGELILGGIVAANNQALLQKHNVKTIITAASGLEQLKVSAEQTHVVFPITDSKTENIEKYFEISFLTIQQNLKRGSVLVHCSTGISRAPSLILAYYMRKFIASYNSALRFLRRKNEKINPNINFELQLRKYQETLMQGNEKSMTNSLTFSRKKPLNQDPEKLVKMQISPFPPKKDAKKETRQYPEHTRRKTFSLRHIL